MKKDFTVLVGTLSEEEDEWDKVSIALALTPDRSTALRRQQGYGYFSSVGEKAVTIPLLLLFSLKNSLHQGLQYLIQKGTLNKGHPLMSKSCFVTSRNEFHDVAAVPLLMKWEWDKVKLLALVIRKCLGQMVKELIRAHKRRSKERCGLGTIFSRSKLLSVVYYGLWSQSLLKKEGLSCVFTNSSSNTSCFYSAFLFQIKMA